MLYGHVINFSSIHAVGSKYLETEMVGVRADIKWLAVSFRFNTVIEQPNQILPEEAIRNSEECWLVRLVQR